MLLIIIVDSAICLNNSSLCKKYYLTVRKATMAISGAGMNWKMMTYSNILAFDERRIMQPYLRFTEFQTFHQKISLYNCL